MKSIKCSIKYQIIIINNVLNVFHKWSSTPYSSVISVNCRLSHNDSNHVQTIFTYCTESWLSYQNRPIPEPRSILNIDKKF